MHVRKQMCRGAGAGRLGSILSLSGCVDLVRTATLVAPGFGYRVRRIVEAAGILPRCAWLPGVQLAGSRLIRMQRV